MQVADFRAHRDAQLGVQVGEGFIKQEEFGFTHDGAADRHALALPARELRGFALQQLAQAQQGCCGAHLGRDLRLRHTDVFQAKGHVVVDRHVRIQRVRLEHHGATAVGGGGGVHALPVDQDVAGSWRLQPGNHTQQRGFAATRGADEDDKLAVLHREIDAVQDGCGIKAFDNALQIKGGHGKVLVWIYLTPALAMPVVMYFCRKANTSVIGINVITVMASR